MTLAFLMSRFYIVAVLSFMMLSPLLFCAETSSAGIALFTPPNDWKQADPKDLSPHIKTMVVGPKLQNDMPPTMNLMIEPYSGTLKSYLKNVKKINDAHGDSWKDLGTLKTKSGEASLSQVEIRSKWGGEKLMHAIIVKNGYAYVLTATAAKSEFGRFYQQFYSALRSLQIYDHLFDLIQDPLQKENLEKAIASIKSAFETTFKSQMANETRNFSKEELFQSSGFQNDYWQPFVTMLHKNYEPLGEAWQQAVLANVQENLMRLN